MVGAGALADVKPIGVDLLDVFCFGDLIYMLLGPSFCFVSFLCLGLCVLADGAWMG